MGRRRHEGGCAGLRGAAGARIIGRHMDTRFALTVVFFGSLLAVGAQTPAPAPAANALGQQMYAVCMACHGPDGKGAPNPAKPGSTLAPPLSGSKLANGDPAIFALIITRGIKKEAETYAQVMAPLPLPPSALAAVMSYVRSNFGNQSAAVTETEVTAYLEKWKDLKEPISRAQLEELGKTAAKP